VINAVTDRAVSDSGAMSHVKITSTARR